MARLMKMQSRLERLSRIGRSDHCERIAGNRLFAMTLLEILVAIAIISLLLGILLPVLGRAREEGRIAVCLANAQSINAAMAMYLSDDGRNLPWFYVHRVDEDGVFHPYPGAIGFTTFSWGGMLPASSPGFADAQVTPVELRPFNRYVAPDAAGFAIVKSYVCPSDSSVANPSFAADGAIPDPDGRGANWREFGTSYSINWQWLRSFDGLEPGIHEIDQRLMHFGPELLRAQVGGRASEYVWASENHMDQLLNAAGFYEDPGSAGARGRGWHGRFSIHTALFLDGHAGHRYFDTRFLLGADWTAILRSRAASPTPG